MKKTFCLLLLTGLALAGTAQEPFHDVGVTEIMTPVSSHNLGSDETVIVKIKNYGTETEFLIPVMYSIDGSPPAVAEMAIGPLEPNQQITWTFTQMVNLLATGCYDISACTFLNGDQRTFNDCYKRRIYHYPPSVLGDTVIPLSVPYWTGSTTGQFFNQDCFIQFDGNHGSVGWARFEPGLPPGNTVFSARLKLNAAFWTAGSSIRLHRLFPDPLASTPADLYDEILGGWSYLDHTGTITPAVPFYLPLTAQVRRDIRLMAPNGFFSFGFSEPSGNAANGGTLNGWGNVALEMTHGAVDHDIELSALNMPGIINLPAVIPSVTITNNGIFFESFQVIFYGNDGYSDTLSVDNLPPLSDTVLCFQPWGVQPPGVSYSAGLSLPDDGFCGNDALYGWCDVILYPLAGRVTYHNAPGTPLDDSTWVFLFAPGGNTLPAAAGDGGYYSFDPVPQGGYLVMAQSQKAWGGVNATDAQLILSHFVGIKLLSGLPLQAADVSGDGHVNSLDALQVVRRFAGLVSSFPVGDWVFEQEWVTILPGSYLQADLKGLCTGDVNGSFVP